MQSTYSLVEAFIATDPTTKTNVIDDMTALNTCACDMTYNSCDAYCCCDQDCPAAMLSNWNQNTDLYCNSYFGQQYRAFTQCIAQTHIYGYNPRPGM